MPNVGYAAFQGQSAGAHCQQCGQIAEADAMVANLRRVIADTECRPDPLTEEWRLTKQ